LSGLGLLRGRVAALGLVIIALLATGITVAATHAAAPSSRDSASAAPGHAAGEPPAAVAAATLRVTSVTPAAGSKRVNGAAPIQVTFSAPLAASSRLPRVVPAIAGRWHRVSADSVEFAPAAGFGQHTLVRVRIPAGRHGMRSENGGLLAAPQTVSFRTGAYSPKRLAQLLAQLRYLPLTWTPASAAAAAGTSVAAERSAAFAPPSGTFSWKHGYPAQLHAFWQHAGSHSLIIKGAVMAFEADHSLALDGIAGPQVWNALFTAAAAGDSNKNGYTYGIASQHLPESLTIWHNGRKVLHTLANTGIPGRITNVGTFPVYLRYLNQIMRGTNPDGTKYADPVKYVSYFNGSDAVHYFPRASYGFPQSLGCVEIQLDPAKTAWSYLTYGSLVTVTPPK
jgi:hypothetical protein